MCQCKKERGTVPDEFMAEYCIECGRIWVIEFVGNIRKTDRFHLVRKPMGGVWIGHTFIKDKSGRLAEALMGK